MSGDVTSVVQRINQALNQHDLEMFVACFAEDYRSEQPVHPDRAFQGREQVRKNWSTVFQEIPDFHSKLLRFCADDQTVWAEWHWSGSPVAGGAFNWKGVTIFGVTNQEIVWGHLYMGPVQTEGAGIDAAVQDMTHKAGTERAAD